MIKSRKPIQDVADVVDIRAVENNHENPTAHSQRTARVTVKTTGNFSLRYSGEVIELPSSLKTRALLAFLLLSGERHSRQSLCEFLWDSVDDPLAGLRWSLSKLRPLINVGGVERLKSDRKEVWLALDDVAMDRDRLVYCTEQPGITEAEADGVWQCTAGALLENCELLNVPQFMIWLEGQRNDLARQRGRLAQRFALDPKVNWQERFNWAERWRSIAPYSKSAAKVAFTTRYHSAGQSAAFDLARDLRRSFEMAGIEPPDFRAEAVVKEDVGGAPADQEIRFVEGKDGVCIAWASVGDAANPPLMKAANWLNHLELDWEAPIGSPLFRDLSRSHRVIRYDERGCGISDWGVGDLTFNDFVEDLEQVVDASGLDRFPLMGISQGAAVSIEYAARHPERVSKLVLFGAYDCGWRHTASPQEVREREAIMVLTESGWGRDNPAYRHMFSKTFMPDASPEELDWFDEFQRQTTSPENAVRFLRAFADIDVRHRLAQLQCPTLVVHSRGDQRIPLATGRRIAARIPDAQFAGLDSANHLLLGREKASGEFVNLVRNFLSK